MLILEVTRVSLLLCHILFIGNHWGQERKLMRRTLLGTILLYSPYLKDQLQVKKNKHAKIGVLNSPEMVNLP